MNETIKCIWCETPVPASNLHTKCCDHCLGIYRNISNNPLISERMLKHLEAQEHLNETRR